MVPRETPGTPITPRHPGRLRGDGDLRHSVLDRRPVDRARPGVRPGVRPGQASGPDEVTGGGHEWPPPVGAVQSRASSIRYVRVREPSSLRTVTTAEAPPGVPVRSTVTDAYGSRAVAVTSARPGLPVTTR